MSTKLLTVDARAYNVFHCYLGLGLCYKRCTPGSLKLQELLIKFYKVFV